MLHTRTTDLFGHHIGKATTNITSQHWEKSYNKTIVVTVMVTKDDENMEMKMTHNFPSRTSIQKSHQNRTDSSPSYITN